MKVKIGTRGSKLALWQAEFVSELLKNGGIETEIITVETKGDKILEQPFSEIGTKGIFTEEIEAKLISGELDIAVHSAKDMQSSLGNDLEIIAFSERENSYDVVVSKNPNFRLADKSFEKTVGTSSTRRTALLAHYYPHIKVKGARGNLQTRIRKMESGEFDAMILAYAGMHRMGYDDLIVEVLPLEKFTPMIGQGCIAIESATGLDAVKKEKIRALVNHPASEKCMIAERAFLKEMDGGCTVPVFGNASYFGAKIILRGGVVSLDGKELITETVMDQLDQPEKCGKELASIILRKGGDKILHSIRNRN